jgi:signal transduction histidine kinase
MAEANFKSGYEFSGFKNASLDTSLPYLRAMLADQLDRRRLLDIFHDRIVQQLVSVQLKMGALAVPNSMVAEVNQLKELVHTAIENAHTLADEISPHVLFRAGLGAALYELFRKYAAEHSLGYYINIKNADFSLLNEDTNIVLYKLVKQLLTGTIGTCHADMIGLNIKTTQTTAEIMMQDNGLSISDFQKILNGYSKEQPFLLEAAEQMRSLGGDIWIDKFPGMRTVYVSVPLQLPDNQ